MTGYFEIIREAGWCALYWCGDKSPAIRLYYCVDCASPAGHFNSFEQASQALSLALGMLHKIHGDSEVSPIVALALASRLAMIADLEAVGMPPESLDVIASTVNDMRTLFRNAVLRSGGEENGWQS